MTLETKEHTTLPWPTSNGDAVPEEAGGSELDRARAALAAEWQAANPKTPQEISRFYEQAHGIGPDLEAWHATPERQEWTRMLVHVAKEASGERAQATRDPFVAVDIGAGAGHDVRALHEALPYAALWAVEPNDRLRENLSERSGYGLAAAPEVACSPIEQADLLICIDVLEHVPDPESFLAGIAQRALIGCLLFETTATHDTATPLHLVENRGWHPGRVLERHGWDLVDHTAHGRVRVWRRVQEAGAQRASILLCAYRSVSLATLQSLMEVCAGPRTGNQWRLKAKGGDALIARSRSIILTDAWRSTNDDVFLFVDDDIVFSAKDADRLTELCRNGHDIVCGAYPVHDGSHLACRFLPGTEEVSFGAGQPPLEIMYAATGFMAVHRRVLDALVDCGVVPLCHADQPWSFYPFFQAHITTPAETPQQPEWLSEDYGFSAIARARGFRVWLDPQTRLEHRGEAGISVRNMQAMHEAIAQA